MADAILHTTDLPEARVCGGKMAEASRTEIGPTLPYGPTKGMMQALQLMCRSTPAKVDGSFLRLNKIAPGNEYKVIGALRFLGIIDEEGRPTEKSKLLKTKGATFTAALQEIVRNAYKSLFACLDGHPCSQEDIYNHFVVQSGLGPEMAAKTTRFFVQLCEMAEIDLGLSRKEKGVGDPKKGSGGPRRAEGPAAARASGGQFPLFLALTPEMASMDTEQLTEFLKKLKTAYARAYQD